MSVNGHGPVFDRTITWGHILTAGMLLLTMAAMFGTLMGIRANDMQRITRLEEREFNLSKAIERLEANQQQLGYILDRQAAAWTAEREDRNWSPSPPKPRGRR